MSRLATAVLLLVLATMAAARMAYVLPHGAESILSARSFSETFSCDNLPYGYYADVDNNCELFHVCLPIADVAGQVLDTAQFTFVCGNQTVFNQETLTCSHADEAVACEEAAALFESTNSQFGVVLDESTDSPFGVVLDEEAR